MDREMTTVKSTFPLTQASGQPPCNRRLAALIRQKHNGLSGASVSNGDYYFKGKRRNITQAKYFLCCSHHCDQGIHFGH